jgi:hypothetical protein
VATVNDVAALFTIVGGSLALIQLTAILFRLSRRPQLRVRIGAVKEAGEDGVRTVVLQIITTNSGSLSAQNVLWNYDLPSALRVLGSDAELHQRQDRVTVVRALEHLHPNVETHHELTLEIPLGLASFDVHYRIHLADARPQAGLLSVALIQRGSGLPAPTQARPDDR